jgi:hypothetical protein
MNHTHSQQRSIALDRIFRSRSAPMLISIDPVGKLNNESSQRSYLFVTRTFMMKSFILAATSIAYILSTANTSVAKDKNQVVDNSAMDRNISMDINISCSTLSSQDINSIHKLITATYKKSNSLDGEYDFDTRRLKTFAVVKKLTIVGCISKAYTRNTEVSVESITENSEYYKDLGDGSVHRSERPASEFIIIMRYARQSNGTWSNNGKWK